MMKNVLCLIKIVLVRHNIQTIHVCENVGNSRHAVYLLIRVSVHVCIKFNGLRNHSITKMLTLLVHMCMKTAENFRKSTPTSTEGGVLWGFSAMVVIAL